MKPVGRHHSGGISGTGIRSGGGAVIGLTAGGTGISRGIESPEEDDPSEEFAPLEEDVLSEEAVVSEETVLPGAEDPPEEAVPSDETAG